MKKIFIVGAVAMVFTACRPSIHVNQNPSAGLADFSNYLAIGNSLTAGYTDGSLTVSGQLHSYPAMLFGQFAVIPAPKGAVGPFIQPHGLAEIYEVVSAGRIYGNGPSYRRGESLGGRNRS